MSGASQQGSHYAFTSTEQGLAVDLAEVTAMEWNWTRCVGPDGRLMVYFHVVFSLRNGPSRNWDVQAFAHGEMPSDFHDLLKAWMARGVR